MVAEKLENVLSQVRGKDCHRGPEHGAKPRLLTDRHQVRDLFIADILDLAASGQQVSVDLKYKNPARGKSDNV